MKIVKDLAYYQRCERTLEEIMRPFPVEQSHGDRIVEICALAKKAIDSQFVASDKTTGGV